MARLTAQLTCKPILELYCTGVQ
ncbi:hypothetical protein B566_EDAN003773, partial [Ephemera danica]